MCCRPFLSHIKVSIAVNQCKIKNATLKIQGYRLLCRLFVIGCIVSKKNLTQVAQNRHVFNVAKCHIFLVLFIYILNTLCQYLHYLMLVSDVLKICHGVFKLMLLNLKEYKMYFFCGIIVFVSIPNVFLQIKTFWNYSSPPVFIL